MKENFVFLPLQFLENIYGRRISASESSAQFYFTVKVSCKEINKEGNTWRSTHSQELEKSSSELLFSQMCIIYRGETSLRFLACICLSPLSCFDTLNLEVTLTSFFPSPYSPLPPPQPWHSSPYFCLGWCQQVKLNIKKNQT